LLLFLSADFVRIVLGAVFGGLYGMARASLGN